uniref:malonyl-CoA-acyl carrier protein transacylase, mitochondrial-like n=1 Tax=Styela clava TaxID=7725 RepID=UPI00193A1359|nr:malonyl-CoA-acyl carrier protein transacylase, mitochondrial-like [Styela clava]
MSLALRPRLWTRRFFFCHRNYNVAVEGELNNDKLMEEQLVNDLFGGTGGSKKIPDKLENTSTLLFPGQGSQYVGMVKNLFKYQNVKDMFDVASEILGFKLLDLCIHGPKNQLDKTIYCQPAVVVTSLAGVEKLQAETPEVLENCMAVAGYSVGEYAALVFSGALTFEDAISLVKIRALEMQKASDDTGGGMISLVGGAKTKFNLACTDAVEYCHEKLGMERVLCRVSGYLAPNIRTVAGHLAALEYLSSQKQNYHIRRVQILPVSGAFHTALMRPAVKKMKHALKAIEVKEPMVTVYGNIDGKPYKDSADIVEKLPEQIIRPVLWEQTVHAMYAQYKNKAHHTYELGPNHKLGVLLKHCNGKAWKNYLPVDNRDNRTADNENG